MFTIDLEQQTNAIFSFSFSLTGWADLYDLAGGSFYMQMRDTASSPIVLYQWDSVAQTIQYLETLANGWITFTQNPVAGESILIGATTITFGTDVNIGIDLAHTMANLLAFVQQSSDPQIMHCTYTVSGTTLNILFKTAGTLGNGFALGASVGAASTSGDLLGNTLSGGGGMLTITAPVSDIENFAGSFVYDCRYESGSIVIPLFGGTIIFTQGVTRDVP